MIDNEQVGGIRRDKSHYHVIMFQLPNHLRDAAIAFNQMLSSVKVSTSTKECQYNYYKAFTDLGSSLGSRHLYLWFWSHFSTASSISTGSKI